MDTIPTPRSRRSPSLAQMRFTAICSSMCGTVIFGLKSNTNENISVGRGDYIASDKSTFFVRALVTNLDKESSYNGVNPLTISSPASHFRDLSLGLGHTYVFGPTVVNSLH